MTSIFAIYKVKRLFQHLFYIINVIPCLLFLILVILLRKLIFIRWYCVVTTRIGHFISEPLIFMSSRPKNELIIFYSRPYICNKYIYKLLKKKFLFLPHSFMYPLHNITIFFEKFMPFLKDHYVHDYETNFGRDVENKFYDSKYLFELSNSENLKGKQLLKKLKIEKSNKIVLLFIRDSEYLKKEYKNAKNWTYHDYRDWNAQNFIPSIMMLINSGYTVIRMGKTAKYKINLNHNKFIDLPFTSLRTDFSDVYLSSICQFGYGTDLGSGHLVNILFRKPFCGFWSSIFEIHTYLKFTMFANKRIFWKSNNQELSFKEIIKLKLHKNLNHNKLIKEKKIIIKENSPLEITEIIEEFLIKIKNNWSQTEQNKLIEDQFWDIYPQNEIIDDSKRNIRYRMHGKKINSSFSTVFLKNNVSWLN